MLHTIWVLFDINDIFAREPVLEHLAESTRLRLHEVHLRSISFWLSLVSLALLLLWPRNLTHHCRLHHPCSIVEPKELFMNRVYLENVLINALLGLNYDLSVYLSETFQTKVLATLQQLLDLLWIGTQLL